MEKHKTGHLAVGTRSSPAVSFFEETAEEFARKYAEETPAGYALRARRKKALELFDKPGGKVLDVGCGPSMMAEELLERGCAFWGVDASLNMVELSRRRLGQNRRVHFLVGEVTELALPAGFFDAVFCLGVLDRVPNSRQALRELLRVLKPGGTLILTFPNPLSPFVFWRRFIFLPLVARLRKLGERWGSARHRPSLASHAREARHFSSRAASKLVAGEGAQVTAVLAYNFNVFPAPLDEIWPRGALAIMRRVEEKRWPCPNWVAGGWLVKSKKPGSATTGREKQEQWD
jgi:ubiquinone/menaquinone biosynthesis C-methylase UbiE